MKGSNGFRRRTRNLRVKPRRRGKISIRARLQRFDSDQTVSIKIDPAYQKIPHPRFNGRTGRISGNQGRAYFVEVQDGGKTKQILVSPEHLKRVG
jgi:large subunit ribosomal protein L21e